MHSSPLSIPCFASRAYEHRVLPWALWLCAQAKRMGYLRHVAGRLALLRSRSEYVPQVRRQLQRTAFVRLAGCKMLHAATSARLHRDFADASFELAVSAGVKRSRDAESGPEEAVSSGGATASRDGAGSTRRDAAGDALDDSGVLPDADAPPHVLLTTAAIQ